MSTTPSNHRLPVVALIFAIAASVLALVSALRGTPSGSEAPRNAETTLARIKRTGVLRVGYGGFPPYTIVNVNDNSPGKGVTGFVVDIVEEMAKRHNPPLKVEWHYFNWATLRPEMASGNFDLLADGLFQTVPLASAYLLSEPFSYFGIGCALVRSDDTRFSDFEDLDRSDITIAVAVGWLSTDYAKQRLINPMFKDIVVEESPTAQMDEVIHGRADVAINDVPSVLAYARAHPGKVKALWVDHPPAVVAGGFATRMQDRDLMNFINVCIRILEVDGTIARIDSKWGGMGYYYRPRLVPGAGLTGGESAEERDQP